MQLAEKKGRVWKVSTSFLEAMEGEHFIPRMNPTEKGMPFSDHGW
jgi:hypothetical protein